MSATANFFIHTLYITCGGGGSWGLGEGGRGRGEGPVAKFTLNKVYDRCRPYVTQHFTNCFLDSLKEHLCWCENEFSNKEKTLPTAADDG